MDFQSPGRIRHLPPDIARCWTLLTPSSPTRRHLPDRGAGFRIAAIAALGMPLAGCSGAGAPAIPLFGAYFPAWMACAFGGILSAIVIRLILIRLGIDDAIPIRLPIYIGIAATIGFLISLTSFGG